MRNKQHERMVANLVALPQKILENYDDATVMCADCIRRTFTPFANERTGERMT